MGSCLCDHGLASEFDNAVMWKGAGLFRPVHCGVFSVAMVTRGAYFNLVFCFVPLVCPI